LHAVRKRHEFPGGLTARVTPVPIPNTEVKPCRADDTARVTAWERRSPPGLNSKRLRAIGAFFISQCIILLNPMTPSTQEFQATIYKIWMLRYVDVPREIGCILATEFAHGDKSSKRGKPSAKQSKPTLPKYIPVVAIVNGRSTRTTLVPAGGGHYRLQFNVTLRKAARADVGDLVGVELRIDCAPRELPIPPELEAALKTRPRLRKEFERLPTGGRLQFLRWFSAKSPEVRKKRLLRALEVLSERALLRSPISSRRPRD
jgi:hypothetical protein